MHFTNSLLFGTTGFYCAYGIDVWIFHDGENNQVENPPKETGIFASVRHYIECSKAYECVMLLHANHFVHEISHAIAYQLLIGGGAIIHINTNLTAHIPGQNSWNEKPTSWKSTMIYAAGSIGNASFSICKLFAARAINRYLPLCVSVPISAILAYGALMQINRECQYAFYSALNNTDGDFGIIKQNGKMHLATASTVLIAQSILAIFMCSKLAASFLKKP